MSYVDGDRGLGGRRTIVVCGVEEVGAFEDGVDGEVGTGVARTEHGAAHVPVERQAFQLAEGTAATYRGREFALQVVEAGRLVHG